MGQIRKIGDIYYIEFLARGLMYSQVAGIDKHQAQKMLEAIEHKISKGEALTLFREVDLEVFFQQFLDFARGQFSLKSIERFSLSWQDLKGFLSKGHPSISKLSQITPHVLESYKAHLMKKTKLKVVNLTILLLREILEYGIKTGFINDNPTLHISLLETLQRTNIKGRRLAIAKELLNKGVGLGKMYEILKLKDVAQIIYWSNFIPLKREDVYTI